jgi:two-component system, cell cycle sensor histidine kinase and response regulator CckA
MSSGRPAKPTDDAAKLFQMVMDNLPQFIFWKDRSSVYLGCSYNFARVAGIEGPHAIVGKTDFDLAWKREEAEYFRKIDDEVMSSGVARYHIVEPQLQADGKQAWLETTKVPLFDDAGQVVGILGTWADITEKRAAKEALFRAQKLESIGRLAGGISHDFNNLLTGIMGFADVLQRRLEGQPELAQMAAGIASAADRAADLTSKLLAFSRRGIMQRRAVDVHRAIENVTSLLARSIGPEIQLTSECRALRCVVMGDVTEIESALLNLGLNARDAMPEGGKLVFATENVMLGVDDGAADFEVVPGQYIRVTVRDTGVGMTPEIRDRVFEPFFTTKEAGAGTGLGLPAVYGATVAHQGAIRVESESGRGSAFMLDLPVADCEAEPSRRRPSGRLKQSGRVLVIDDQDTVLQAMQQILEGMGLQVVTATEGAAGVAFLTAAPATFDLAIVDMIMPRMSGRDCFHAIKALRPDLPVLLVSGFLQDELLEDLTRDGSATFLKKPFGRAGLSQAVTRALSRGSSEQPAQPEPLPVPVAEPEDP